MRCNSPPLRYSDHIEAIPASEAADIAEVVDTIRVLIQQKARQCGRFFRDVHVKSHGCVRGEFRVLNDLPTEFAQGLFARPGTYSATLRFSNSSPIPQTDLLPDGRGCAIQVHNVEGEFLRSQQTSPTQDFLLVNHPTFLARDVADYLQLQRFRLQLNQAGIFVVHRALTGNRWNPASWRWREAWAAAQIATQFPRHPAAYTYFSMTPFRHGEYVAKYRVHPRDRSASAWLVSSIWQRDAMRLALEESLRTRELILDFQAQLRTSTATMPIEDATQEWSEHESPFRTVAEIRIPPQDLSSSIDRDTELSFDVWHALEAHRPLGGINRVRRAAYPASVALRRTDAMSHSGSPVEPDRTVG